MRYLSDSEILSWNKRFQGHWFLTPHFTSHFSQPVIGLKQVIKAQSGESFAECGNPTINFNFIFSISSNRNDDFFRIYDRLKEDGFGTKFSWNNKFEEIQIDQSVIIEKNSATHKIEKKEFIRWEYKLKGKLTAIVAMITTLEDAIKFAETMWGYDKDGKEISLLKFPVGTIVSPKDNKSLDCVVLDYHFVRDWRGFEVQLKVAEMEVDGRSPVVKYGEVKTFSESDLVFSRNSRIDGILN